MMIEHLREFWRHRDLTISFTTRDLKARYKQTALGVAWAILQPLLLMVVFTVVFSRFARVPSDGIPYPVFAYSALIFWTFFAKTLLGGTIAIVASGDLIRKIYFPRETLLVSVVLSGLIDLAVAATVFAGFLVYYQVPLAPTVVWVPVLLALQTLFVAGLIFFTAPIHVRFRDVGHAVPLLVQLWMFATPVAYPVSVVPESLRALYLLNPMAPIVDGYRRAILHGQTPEVGSLLVSAVVTLVLLLGGYATFKHAERTFADVI
jgi:homopolymeric O-antigen transport system permease protein